MDPATDDISSIIANGKLPQSNVLQKLANALSFGLYSDPHTRAVNKVRDAAGLQHLRAGGQTLRAGDFSYGQAVAGVQGRLSESGDSPEQIAAIMSGMGAKPIMAPQTRTMMQPGADAATAAALKSLFPMTGTNNVDLPVDAPAGTGPATAAQLGVRPGLTMVPRGAGALSYNPQTKRFETVYAPPATPVRPAATPGLEGEIESATKVWQTIHPDWPVDRARQEAIKELDDARKEGTRGPQNISLRAPMTSAQISAYKNSDPVGAAAFNFSPRGDGTFVAVPKPAEQAVIDVQQAKDAQASKTPQLTPEQQQVFDLASQYMDQDSTLTEDAAVARAKQELGRK
jgi:hypothetical protein